MRSKRQSFGWTGKILLAVFSLIFLFASAASALGKKKKYTVTVEPVEATMAVGDTLLFTAVMTDEAGHEVDTAFVWSLTGREVGTIDGQGQFVALEPGVTTVIASVGKYAGRARVTVEGDRETGTSDCRIEIVPHDTVLVVGSSIQFEAIFLDRDGNAYDTTFTWELEDPAIGTIDASGFFTSTATGNSRLYAYSGDAVGRGHITVVRDTALWQWYKGLKVEVSPRDTVLDIGAGTGATAAVLQRDGYAGLAVADVRAREVLELQRDVLGHMARPGPVPQPRDEAAHHRHAERAHPEQRDPQQRMRCLAGMPAIRGQQAEAEQQQHRRRSRVDLMFAEDFQQPRQQRRAAAEQHQTDDIQRAP